MLVLTRQKGESLILCDPRTCKVIASISVEQIRSGSVRLGISASKETVGIHRQELYEQISQQQPSPEKSVGEEMEI